MENTQIESLKLLDMGWEDKAELLGISASLYWKLLNGSKSLTPRISKMITLLVQGDHKALGELRGYCSDDDLIELELKCNRVGGVEQALKRDLFDLSEVSKSTVRRWLNKESKTPRFYYCDFIERFGNYESKRQSC